MKKLTLLIISFYSISSYAQYSGYYGTYSKVDANINVESNINTNSTITKTVKTIDYGALELANAENERNRLAALKYSDNKEREEAYEIAMDPLLAFDYGTGNTWTLDRSEGKGYGFSKYTSIYHKQPHKSLFDNLGSWKYLNESLDGVVTEIDVSAPYFIFGMEDWLELDKKTQKKYYENWKPVLGDSEKYVKRFTSKLKVGEIDEDGRFVHKVGIKKTKVFGNDGFVYTVIYEDDYEFVIKERYRYISKSGVLYKGSVTYKGDKEDVSFEMLEGRRSYLKRLCAKVIGTARLTLGKKGLLKASIPKN
tara:strand:+ start:97 stop:1020 length:924 start_codon:yes stop_codon:yes gene_type:complete